MPHRRRTPATRVGAPIPPKGLGRAVVLLAASLVALGALLGWQTISGLGNIQQMMVERSLALHRVIATEVVNVARFGASRRERLEAVLGDLVTSTGAVHGVLLEQQNGPVRIERGTLPEAAAVASPEPTVERLGTSLLVSGTLQVVTSGCSGAPVDSATAAGSTPSRHAEAPASQAAAGCGCDHAGSGPTAEQGAAATCPAAGDAALDGQYRLVLALAAAPYLALQRTVYWQGIGGALLIGALALALWLFARQSRRAADMRQALALADARARHLESLGLVAGGLAHEIKNPVSALRGFAQLIAERVAEGSQEAEYAELIVAELDGITRRIDGLRHFTRPRQAEFRPARPSKVVRRVVALLTPDAAAREVKLDLQLPDPVEPETLLDEEALRDLVVNLLMNALEASPRGKRVTIGLSFEPGSAGVRGGGHYQLEVADEGPGIPAAEREECLRPFYTTKAGGLGLGLALVQRAVEDHGGRLEIAVAPGGGALLRVRWPRRVDHEEQDRSHR